MRLRSVFLLSLSLGCGTARSGGGGDPLPTDAPPVDDTPADAPAPTFDIPVTPDVPVAPDVPVTPDVPTSPDRPVVTDTCASGAESSSATCHDGRDNDCDGLTDCDDANCVAFCGATDAGRDACVATGLENTNAACSDGRDNDCDGFIDCGATGSPDFDCTRTATVTVCPRDGGLPTDGCVATGPENTNAACSDGRDNDCDGYVDCGGATSEDFDCTRTATVTVCPRDGGLPTDNGCVASGRENSATTCSDGVDEDCDGYIDCMDRDCSCVGTCAAFRVGCACRGPENTNAACSDGVDNDCDGYTDCSASSVDFDCTTSPAVTLCARDGG